MIKRKKGFTLIELLVVITIIAVLAAILFPVFLMARAKARAINCMNNMKQLGSFFAMYMSDWNGTYPTTSIPRTGMETIGGPITETGLVPTTIRNVFWANSVDGYSNLWPVKLEPYVRYKSFYRGQAQGIFRCKEIAKSWTIYSPLTQPNDQAGYGYNFLYLGMPYRGYTAVGYPYSAGYNSAAYTASGVGFKKGAAKQSTIKNISQTICLVDNQFIWAFPPRKATGGSWVSGNFLIRPRHSGQVNVAWADGHVTALEARQLVANGQEFGNGTTVSPPQIGNATNNSLWDLY